MELTTQIKLTRTINGLEPKPKELLINIIEKLQLLKQGGKTNDELSTIIYDLNLPLNIHLFITGNFSNLMQLKFY